MGATTHVHLVFGAQVMEGARSIATATPFRAGPRLGHLELEIGENRRRLRDIRRCCGIFRIQSGVCVTADRPCPPIHQFALRHQFVHLRESDLEGPIDPAQLLQQLFTLVVVAVEWTDKGGGKVNYYWPLICLALVHTITRYAMVNGTMTIKTDIRKHYYGHSLTLAKSTDHHCTTALQCYQMQWTWFRA